MPGMLKAAPAMLIAMPRLLKAWPGSLTAMFGMSTAVAGRLLALVGDCLLCLGCWLRLACWRLPQRVLAASLCGRSVLSDKSACEADSWPRKQIFIKTSADGLANPPAPQPVADLVHTGDKTFPSGFSSCFSVKVYCEHTHTHTNTPPPRTAKQPTNHQRGHRPNTKKHSTYVRDCVGEFEGLPGASVDVNAAPFQGRENEGGGPQKCISAFCRSPS